MEDIWTADIEANNWIDFLMLGLHTGSEYKVFFSIDDFLDYVIHPRAAGKRIYFHNGANYDFTFILGYLWKRHSIWSRIQWIERANKVISFSVPVPSKRNHPQWVQFADSITLLKGSLEKLIEAFGVTYKKIPVNFEKKHTRNDVRLLKHLENDTFALREVLERFCLEMDIHRLRDLKLTIASQAMHIFKHKYCFHKLERLWLNEDEFKEKFYHGGRVEIYKGYGKNLHHYDVNSLYPYAMLEDQPVGMYRTTVFEKKNKIGFYRVKILHDTNFPASPLIHKTKEGNYFVNAKSGNEFYVSSVDLQYLRDEGVKYKVLDGLYFDGKDNIFTEYVNDFYEMKMKSTGARREIAKLLMNALYGRFGMSRNSMQLTHDEGQWNAEDFSVEYGLVLVPTERRSKFILPYLAAWITSNARIIHLRYQDRHKNDNYYCDTDSIFSSAVYPSGKQIGQLKEEDLEHKGISEAVFLLPKTYALRFKDGKEQVKVKGFHTGEFTFDDLFNALKTGKKLKRISSRIMSIKEAMLFDPTKETKRIIKRHHRPFLYLLQVSKELKPTFLKLKEGFATIYDKRKLIRDVKHIFTSVPFFLTEISKKSILEAYGSDDVVMPKVMKEWMKDIRQEARKQFTNKKEKV